MLIPLCTNVHPSMYKCSFVQSCSYIVFIALLVEFVDPSYMTITLSVDDILLSTTAEIQVEEYYPTFLNMAKNYMEGNIDGSTYGDTCREMFGVHAYLVFTLDRLVQNIVRQVREFNAMYYIHTSVMHN